MNQLEADQHLIRLKRNRRGVICQLIDDPVTYKLPRGVARPRSWGAPSVDGS
jgi:hypothetical protein